MSDNIIDSRKGCRQSVLYPILEVKHFVKKRCALALINEWKFERAGEGCAECGTKFSEGDFYHSVLNESDEGFARVEFCSECFCKIEKGEAFGFWRSKKSDEAKNAKTVKKRSVDPEVLLNIFYRLEGVEEPSKQGFRYIVALMLTRKRLLAFEDVDIVDNRSYLLFKDRAKQCVHRVIDPSMSEEEISKVTEEVVALFEV